MRNLLALVGAALISFLAVGYFLNWYSVETVTDKEGHKQVDIDVNRSKITDDLSKGFRKVIDAAKDKKEVPAQPVSQPNTGPLVVTPASGSTAPPPSTGSWIHPQ